MSDRVTIGVVQSGDCNPDIDGNVDRLVEMFRRAATTETDLVVFPEMATVPYFACATYDPTFLTWATPVPGPITDRFASVCRETNTALALGLYERDADGKRYNSLVFLGRDGGVVPAVTHEGARLPAYRKLALQDARVPGFWIDERSYCTAGQGPAVFDWEGRKYGALICYDRAFSEVWLANRALGAEIIIAPISSFGWREQLFVDDLRLRAMEVGCFVIAANRGGLEHCGDRSLEYFGRSCVVAPDGAVLVEAPRACQPEIVRATIDLGVLVESRKRWKIWDDRRPELFRFLHP